MINFRGPLLVNCILLALAGQGGSELGGRFNGSAQPRNGLAQRPDGPEPSHKHHYVTYNILRSCHNYWYVSFHPSFI